MRILIIITAALVLAGSLAAQTVQDMHRMVVARKSAVPASYLVNETFETAVGYDESWSENTAAGGTVDEDSTTSPLVGSQSLRLDATTITAIYTERSFTNVGTTYGYLAFNYKATPSTNVDRVVITDSSGNTVGRLVIGSVANRLIIASPGGTSVNIDGWAPGTIYFWWKYTPGTGTNAEFLGWLSATSTKPGSPSGSITNGTSTADSGRIRITSTNRADEPLDVDNVRVASVALSDGGALP